MRAKVEWALAAAARGFLVFPLQVNEKTPWRAGWQETATRDARVIRAWWRENPEYNIGIKTGDQRDGKSFLLVGDYDTKHGKAGLASLATMTELGMAPPTLRARTPTNGAHLYYHAPRDCGLTISADKGEGRRGRIEGFPDVDVRCESGLVVAPGSTINGALYEWTDDVPVASAPIELIAAFRTVAGKNPRTFAGSRTEPLAPWDGLEGVGRAVHYLRNEAPKALSGQAGDTATFAVACRVRDFAVSESKCFELMSVHWNEAGKAEPPWQPEELERKIANAYRYGQNPPGIALASVEFDPVPPSTDLTRGTLVDLGRPTAYTPPEELVRDMIPAIGVGFAGGQSGGLKTFGCIDLSVCVATGSPFVGRLIEKLGAALYVAFEGRDTIAGRVLARRSLLPDPDADIPLMALNDFGALTTDNDRESFRTSLRQIKDYAFHRWNVPLRMIVIDTVTAAGLIGEDQENDPAAWQRNVFDFFNPIATRMKLAILLVHHFGKSATAGLRGSSNARAGADFVLVLSCDRNEITGETSNHALALSKSRTGAEGPLATISKRSVEIGKRADGTPVTTLVLDFEIGARPQSATRKKLTKAAQTFLTAAMLALEEHGEDIRVEGVPRRAVRRTSVRKLFIAAYAGSEGTDAKGLETARKQFANAWGDVPAGWNTFVHADEEWACEAVFDGSEFEAVDADV